MTRRRRRRRWSCLVVVLGMLVAAVVTTELILRARVGHVLGPAAALVGMFEKDGRGGVQTVPGWTGELTVDGRTVEIELDSLGMRGPEFPPRPGPASRVLVLGDSMVFGFGVTADEAFPAVLQRRLSAELERPVQVGNGAAPGFGTVDAANSLTRFMRGFDPDVIVVVIYLGNDFVENSHVYRTVVDGYKLVGPMARMVEDNWRARFALRFRLAYILEDQLARWLPAASFDRTGKAWATPEDIGAFRYFPTGNRRGYGLFMDAVEENALTRSAMHLVARLLARISHDAGESEVLVVILPSWVHVMPGAWEREIKQFKFPYDKYAPGQAQRRLIELCERRGLPVVDLTPRMVELADPEELYLPVDRHFSVVGHERVADWLAPFLAEHLGR